MATKKKKKTAAPTKPSNKAARSKTSAAKKPVRSKTSAKPAASPNKKKVATKKTAAKKKAAPAKKKAAPAKKKVAKKKTAAKKPAAKKPAAKKKAATTKKKVAKKVATKKAAPSVNLDTHADLNAGAVAVGGEEAIVDSAPVAAPAKASKAEKAPKAEKPAKAEKPVEKPALTIEDPRDPTIDLAHAVAALALDKKAEDVVILKVSDLTSYADCFILASAPSERQVQAIARNVDDEMRKAGKQSVGTEGLEQGQWVLVDLGAVVLHVFLSSARQYYDLEGFWQDAPRLEPNEARGKEFLAAMAAAYAERRAAAANE